MLWPFVLQYAADLWNHIPDIQSGLSPIDKFSGTVNDHTRLLSAHVWGFPTYVLDPKLQDGKKLTKWSHQKRQGQFLEWSQSHALSVTLTCNLCTDSIIPQFHTVMDDWFTKIAREGTYNNVVPPENWSDLLKTSLINALAEWDTKVNGHYLDLATKWLTDVEINQSNLDRNQCFWSTIGSMPTQQEEHDDEGDEDSALNDVLPAPEGAESTEPVTTPGGMPEMQYPA